jgi:hypothetical protein
MICKNLFYHFSMKRFWRFLSRRKRMTVTIEDQGLRPALQWKSRSRRVPRLAQRKPRSQRVRRRQTFGCLFPGADSGPGSYIIQGKEYGSLEIRKILHALIEQRPAKQYVDEYEELLRSLTARQFRVADYSHIVNLGNRLGVTPAPHIISNPDNPPIQKH